jgi:hypothetical protein
VKEDVANTMPDAVRSFESVTEDAHIGRYRILRRLETNEISEVVLAVTEGAFGFERAVAIKRLLPHAHADPKRARSFGQEASAYARLTHPAIVRLYDFFTVDDMPAMVLEYVDGVSLQTLVEQLRARGQKLPMVAALYIGTRIFAALSAAHGARDPATGALSPVIHRDVSPANVLVGRDGEVKLSNFGFAKLVGASAATDTNIEAPKGTLEYMAPEQLLCGSISPRTDVYAAALVLRELLSGTPAFVRGSEVYVDYLQAIAKPSLAPVASVCAGLPRAVASALASALEPDVEKRVVTAVGVQRVLNAHRADGRAKLLEVLAALGLGLAQTGGDEPADEEPGEEPGRSSITVRSVLQLEVRARRARLAATAFGACAILFGVVALRSDVRAARGSTTPVSAPAPSLALPPVAAPPAQPTPAPTEPARIPATVPPSPPPTTGEIRMSTPMPGHRVFVDDRLAGDSGAVLTLPCGAHTVRVGSSGKAERVTVPCGGSVVVSAR